MRKIKLVSNLITTVDETLLLLKVCFIESMNMATARTLCLENKLGRNFSWGRPICYLFLTCDVTFRN
jgi:hypothetical protein